ncbi:hypothetical protein FQA39_LY18336 [Lamprigera yunnana]|nr:hypothetical protein FQA39_LY18336 [Lamprigera yunnana]
MQSSHSQNDRQAEQESEENTRETTCIQGESSCIENQSNELIEMTNVLYDNNIRIADEVTAQNCKENLGPEKMPSIEIQKLDNHSNTYNSDDSFKDPNYDQSEDSHSSDSTSSSSSSEDEEKLT